MNISTQSVLRTIGWLVVGLVVGLGLGLFLGWVVWPAEFTDADPTVLEDQYKRDYTLMIASTYWIDADLNAARIRLDNLGTDDPFGWYRDIALDYILGEENEEDIRYLVNLAADLGIYSQVMEPYWPGTARD